ncbi:ABC transporter substrate-binding protein [Salinispirillum marinum]|uniref:ABC transporter substrate-binding protein n=2 Tax=Saccharospirillaceae TaxID=255527 RepID=A0ABV8BCM0_9GAMM
MKYALWITLMSSLIFATPVWAQDCTEGYRLFAHAAGEDCIPVNPQRIVTLQDQNGLLPLMELGVQPIASAGHINGNGEQVYRRMQGYDTSGVTFIGTYREPDFEAVAAQQPDLIIASPWPAEAYEMYSKIAPTIVIDMFSNDLEVALYQFADAVNRTERAQSLEAELQQKVAELRATLGDRLDSTTLSIIAPEYQGDGFYAVEPTQAFGAIRRALDPVMSPPERTWAIDRNAKSIESLGEHTADVMFLITYDADQSGNSTSFDDFVSRPLVCALPVYRAGQFYPLNGGEMVGSAWGKIMNGLDQIAEVLLQDDLNRDLVAE